MGGVEDAMGGLTGGTTRALGGLVRNLEGVSCLPKARFPTRPGVWRRLRRS